MGSLVSFLLSFSVRRSCFALRCFSPNVVARCRFESHLKLLFSGFTEYHWHNIISMPFLVSSLMSKTKLIHSSAFYLPLVWLISSFLVEDFF